MRGGHSCLEHSKLVTLEPTSKNNAGLALEEGKLSLVIELGDSRQADIFVVISVQVGEKLD